MKIRKNRGGWHNGLGLGQIMATLLVVLPTLAFSVTFLLSYWNVMQIDYRLKLIANLAADFANQRTELRTFGDAQTTTFLTAASKLCPKGRVIPLSDLTAATDTSKGIINITIQYTTPATDTYFSNQKISTNIQTYSFHDQNMSVTLTCPNS